MITVNGLNVQVVRKAIKNLHLGVYPPTGRVRVAAPLALSDRAVRLAVVGKLAWIKRKRARFLAQPRQSQREMVSGESHYFLGRRYCLRVVEHKGAGKVVLRSRTTLELHVRPQTDATERERVLQHWYRQHLRDAVPPLIAKWETILVHEPRHIRGIAPAFLPIRGSARCGEPLCCTHPTWSSSF